jgi:hypothetical protein
VRDARPTSWHTIAVTTLIDTHRLINDLKQRGFTEQQAEGITQVIEAQDLDNLATKADLRSEIHALEIRTIKWAVPILLGQVAVFAAVVEWVLKR